jgi:hypothetical protein
MTGFRHIRRRLGARFIVAVLYAACVIAPHAALAVSKAAAHCLTDVEASHVHGGSEAATPHAHADDTIHQHANAASKQPLGSGESHESKCCGLFCLTALAPASAPDSATPAFVGLIVVGLDDTLSGRLPERITRPPIA